MDKKYFRFRKHTIQSVDSKGRVAVPKEFRNILSSNKEDSLILNKGYDGEILVYPLSVWEQIEDNILTLPYIKKEVRFYARRMLSFSSEVKIDNQGRINIPSYLLKYAGIDNEVVIAGVGDHFELWSPEKFESFELYSEEKLEDYLVDMGDIWRNNGPLQKS